MSEKDDYTSGSEQIGDPIRRVKQSNGELVLDYDSRVGARPYARYVDGEWDLMSLSYVPTPKYGEPDDSETGHNTKVHTVDLEPDPIPESELREMAQYPRHPMDDAPEWAGVKVIAYEDSPFPNRDQIPSRGDIVREQTCDTCGSEFRQYIPDPFDFCPECGESVDVPDTGNDQW